MARILAVPCLRYSSRDLVAQLEVVADDAGNEFLTCLSRGFLVPLTPEEGVRQSLLWFLLNRSDSASQWTQQLCLKAEHRQLDVVAYFSGGDLPGRFTPRLPVAVFETKRIEENTGPSSIWLDQLQDYLLRDHCSEGLLFNGHDATWVKLKGDRASRAWESNQLTDLRDLDRLFLSALNDARSRHERLRKEFLAASEGDFEALRLLVVGLGHDTGLTFAISLRTGQSMRAVQACQLRFRDSGSIVYRERFVLSRQPCKIDPEDFHRLLSITPLSESS